MKVSPVILAVFSTALTLLLSVSHARAGSWSTHAWTGDESTGFAIGKTVWAYRFGTGEDAAINGVSVPVITTKNASIEGKVAFSNFAEIITFSDSNNLTALGGTGSALMASRFTYGGVPMETVTVSSQSLAVGQSYQVSFFSVGWDGDAGDARQVKFVSGADELSVNQNMFGGDHGLRVDYTFTATGGDMTFNIQVDNAMNRTLHLYAVALNQNIVFSTADSGVGSLRDVIAAAPAGSTVTFAPELNGQTITLASPITLTKDVSLDASSLSSGITISGGHATRLFIVNSGQSVAMHGLTLVDGLVSNGSGGAIYHSGKSLIMTQCSLIGNEAILYGGAIYANGDQTLLQGCTLAENKATRGGSIYNFTNLDGEITRLEQCTVTRNSATTLGGGLYNYEGLLEIHQCTITDNKAPDEWGAGVCSFGDKLTETRVGNSIVSGNIPSDVDYTRFSSFIDPINSFVSLGENIIGDGNAVDEFSKEGGITGNADPRLARLGDYGGLTQTMPPLAGSVAIDASGTEDPGGADQRGLPRFMDGNGDGTAALDAGAVEARTALIVTTSADSGPGSLRQTVADAPPGSVIYFDETVFLGGASATITYAPSSEQIIIDKQLQIDGSNISGGVILNAAGSDGNRKRVMEVSSTGDVTLIGLTLTGGYADGDGGALNNYGQVSLLRCRLTNNTAIFYGGAVFSYSFYKPTQVVLRQCSVDGNRALANGAGLFNWAANSHEADMELEGCTVTGNETTGVAGGLYNYSTLGQATLNAWQCTVTNNEASRGAGCVNWGDNSGVSACELTNCTIIGNTASSRGGGIYNYEDDGSSPMTLGNTIVAGNTAPTSGDGPDIRQVNSNITSNGGNFIGKTDGSSVAWLETDQKGTAAAPIDPLLTPLGQYGGPTLTMPPMPGSPVIDKGLTAFSYRDQRDLLRLLDGDGQEGATVDAGAVEYDADVDSGPGTLAFQSPFFSVQEDAGIGYVPVARTGGSFGTVTVQVDSTPGTATAADFEAVTSYILTFEHGETVKYVPVTLFADPALKEPNETFSLTLSDPTNGAVLGTPNPGVVRIIDSYDKKKPTLKLLTPRNKAVLLEDEGPEIAVTGMALDNQGIEKVLLSLNGANFISIPLSHSEDGTGADFDYPLTIYPGVHSLILRAVDTRGQNSKDLKVSFTYRVIRPLEVIVSGPEGSGTVSKGFEGVTDRDLGSIYNITATPKSGYIFAGWTVTGAVGSGIFNLQNLKQTFVMREGLVLTATFVMNPFTPELVGTFSGLAVPNTGGGAVPGIDTVGLFNLVLSTKGSFSASFIIDGVPTRVSGAMSSTGVALFGKDRVQQLNQSRKGLDNLAMLLNLDMSGATGRIAGQSASFNTSANVLYSYTLITADRVNYSSKNKVDSLLAGAKGQRYSSIFPSKEQEGLTAMQYPQGTGIGSLFLKSDGKVTFAGTLADNTKFTASSALSKTNAFPLFAQLYSKKGLIAGEVTVDPTQTMTDLGATDCFWVRPEQTKQQWYPEGWPSGLKVDLVGAQYQVPTETSVIPNLEEVGATEANAEISFYDGLLTESIHKAVNISTKNKVTNVPATDKSFKVTINKANGEIKGNFTDESNKKVNFLGATLQKPGDYQGSWGFFMSYPAKPTNGEGQSGEVQLLPPH